MNSQIANYQIQFAMYGWHIQELWKIIDRPQTRIVALGLGHDQVS